MSFVLQVRAEHNLQTGGNKKRHITELWKALGVDPETTPNHLTLGEIGIESMFAVELQQELEREFNIKTNVNQIKTITVGLLKEYENGRTRDIKNFIESMKKARELFTRFNFTIPSEPFTKLNNVTRGRPIYFMPPLEITFSAYESFAQKFDRPVIGLNWTRDCSQFQTMKDINQYFTELLKKLEPKGDFDMIGYLDGALVVTKQLVNGRLRRGVIIDVLNDDRVLKEKVSEDLWLEIVFDFLLSEIPDSFRAKVRRSVFEESDTSAKIKRLSNEIRDFVGRGLIAPDLEEIIKIAIKRANILWEYRLKKKTKFGNALKERIGKKWAKKSGKLHVIKAFRFDKCEDIEAKTNSVRETYLLPDEKSSSDVLSAEAVDYHNSYGVTSEEIGNRIIKIFVD